MAQRVSQAYKTTVHQNQSNKILIGVSSFRFRYLQQMHPSLDCRADSVLHRIRRYLRHRSDCAGQQCPVDERLIGFSVHHIRKHGAIIPVESRIDDENEQHQARGKEVEQEDYEFSQEDSIQSRSLPRSVSHFLAHVWENNNQSGGWISFSLLHALTTACRSNFSIPVPESV
jgi:hypothetical protein